MHNMPYLCETYLTKQGEGTKMIKLYSYYRSSASYRVRIALNIKNMVYETKPIHLVNNQGEQHSVTYKNLNPQELVPTLIDGDFTISQSLAIIDYIEDIHSTPSLYPNNRHERALCKSIAQSIACEIHPLNNLRVLQYLTHDLNCDEKQKIAWYQHWVHLGFQSIETLLEKNQMMGKYCFGDTITVADCCLIPQVYNAIRFNCDLSEYPHIKKINEECIQHPAFIKALPENQIDAK